MANGNVPLSLTFTMRGQNTVAQALRDQQRIITDTKLRYESLAKSGQLSLKQQANAAVAMNKKVAAAGQEMRRIEAAGATTAQQKYMQNIEARRFLGIRSEKSIQDEIKKTQKAYENLAKSGAVSAKELARAQDASLKKVKQLKDELKGANGGGRNVLTGAVLAAGAYSTYAAIKNAYEQNLSLDERLGLRANAAYRGKSVEEKRAGEAKMRGGIKDAVAGGLTAEDAMSTLDELIAKNQVGGVDNAIKLLPTIAKFKTGQGGSPVEAASLISTLMGSGFAGNLDQATKQLDMIAAAGGAGAFETADLAKHLPNLLALAKTQGYVGDAGLKRVLVMLEQGMTTAGSADESANNLKNLFSKMNSNDTAIDFKKMGRGDLANTMLKARAAGKTPDEVYLEVIAQETKNNPKLRAAMKAAAQAKDETEREERIKAVNELAKGQAIGKLFQDMQAKGAFLALLNEAFGKEVAAAIDKSSGVVDKDAAYMQEKTGYKKRVADESKKMAEYELVDKLNPVMNAYYEATTKLANEFPLLSGATTLATGALTALAGAALLNVPGGKLPGLPKSVPNVPKSVSGATNTAKNFPGTGIGALFTGAAPLAAMLGVSNWVEDTSHDKERVGSLMGVTDMLNNFLGLNPDAKQKEWRAKKDAELGITPQVELKQTIGLAPGLVITSQTSTASGVKHQSNTGNLMNGVM